MSPTRPTRRSIRRIAAVIAAAIVVTIAVSPASVAAADSEEHQFPIAWAPIGIYPRPATEWGSGHVGPALPNGSPVRVVCETDGQAVSSSAGTSTIWDRLADPAGAWIPNVFLGTGYPSWTPGVPRCTDYDAQKQSGPNASEDPAVGFDDGSGAKTTCGAWWPGDGASSVTSTRPLGDSATVALKATFRFSQARLDALRCTGDIALEVDAIVDGVAAGTGTVSFDSTLPTAYDDTEYMDDPQYRNLSMGTTHLNDLRADTDYTVNISVTNPTFDASAVTMWLNFQRGHWARWKFDEMPACLKGQGTEPWCVFSSETVRMQDHGLSAVTVPLDANSSAASAAAWTSTSP